MIVVYRSYASPLVIVDVMYLISGIEATYIEIMYNILL